MFRPIVFSLTGIFALSLVLEAQTSKPPEEPPFSLEAKRKDRPVKTATFVRSLPNSDRSIYRIKYHQFGLVSEATYGGNRRGSCANCLRADGLSYTTTSQRKTRICDCRIPSTYTIATGKGRHKTNISW
jgi:hypothetical protein